MSRTPLNVSDKNLRKLIIRLQSQGFTIRRGGNGHLWVLAPDGEGMASLSTTTKHKRGIKNDISKLRRIGAKV